MVLILIIFISNIINRYDVEFTWMVSITRISDKESTKVALSVCTWLGVRAATSELIRVRWAGGEAEEGDSTWPAGGRYQRNPEKKHSFH